MATPTPAAHLPTRQQLDEIDALLSRMLALPPVAGEPAPAEPVAAAPPVEMTFPAPIIREVPPARPAAPEEPVVKAWRVQWPPEPAPPVQPSSVAAWGSPVPLATLAEDPEPPAPPNDQHPASPVPAAPVPVAEAVPDQVPAVVPLRLWPFIGLNVAFNVLTHLLGPSGSWLRGSGRTLMGWIGIGMILTAGTWAAGEWLGYDWPKVDLSRLDLSKVGLSR